jgi:hypothetical protein
LGLQMPTDGGSGDSGRGRGGVDPGHHET